MNGLMLHTGSRDTTLDEIARGETPAPTESYFRIPHSLLIREVRAQIIEAGIKIKEEAFGLSTDRQRFVGLTSLNAEILPTVRGSDLVLGLRNSHDKSVCAGLALGNRVMVCDNLSFYGTAQKGSPAHFPLSIPQHLQPKLQFHLHDVVFALWKSISKDFHQDSLIDTAKNYL